MLSLTISNSIPTFSLKLYMPPLELDSKASLTVTLQPTTMHSSLKICVLKYTTALIPLNCWQTKRRKAVNVALRYFLETMVDHPAVFTSPDEEEAISVEASAPQSRSASRCDVVDLCATDTIATLSPFTHETRGRSCDHEDAIAATTSR